MLKSTLTVLFIGIFLGGAGNLGFAEDAVQLSDSKEIERAIEKAIKKVNQDKDRENEALIVSLEGKLRKATEEWIVKEKSEKNSGLNKEVEQDWEFLSKYGPRVHYKYYLRDYDYKENDFDIMDTDSVLVPYEGYSNVTELLYVEREHPASPSDMKVFYYTATTPLKVNFDYKKDGFIFTSVERGELSLKQGWPEGVMVRLKAR